MWHVGDAGMVPGWGHWDCWCFLGPGISVCGPVSLTKQVPLLLVAWALESPLPGLPFIRGNALTGALGSQTAARASCPVCVLVLGPCSDSLPCFLGCALPPCRQSEMA